MRNIARSFLFIGLILSNTISAQVISSTTIQVGNTVVYQNTINNLILRVEIETGPSAVTLTEMLFTTNGCDNPTTDLANAKLWFSGISPAFNTANATLLVTWTPNVPFPWATNFAFMTSGSMNNTGLSSFNGMIAGQKNYFWLTYNITPSAYICNYVDAQFLQFKANSTILLPSIQSPPGNSQIGPCPTGISEIENNPLLTIFPVPATDEINLTFTKQIATPISIDLLEISGKLIIPLFKGIPESNISSLRISLKNYAPGLYLIRTRYDGKESLSKIVLF